MLQSQLLMMRGFFYYCKIVADALLVSALQAEDMVASRPA